MYQRFKDRFGTAGLVVAVIALVAAVGGSALAAGGLTKSQEKQVTKIAKKYAGKPGATGPAGSNGTNGKDGKDGANGASVNVSAYTGSECQTSTEEGAKFTNGTGTAYACTGEEGPEGPEGSPWTQGGTLPSGKTETGAWGGIASPGPNVFAISFPLPLPAALDAAHVKGIKVGGTIPPECEDTGHTGTASPTNPEADPGYLCVYASVDSSGEEKTPAPKDLALSNGASTAGGFVSVGLGEPAFFFGSFAVTAP